MAFEPFHRDLSRARAVRIPDSLAGEQRERFIARMAAAARQQAELAGRCSAVLPVTGEVREQGALVVIRHAPARALRVADVLAATERPDVQGLSWFAWSLARGLAAAHEAGLAHGGLTLASVYQDETGRLRLGDVGIASAIEGPLGREARRQICCEDAADGGDAEVRGVWGVLAEGEARDHGWIAASFAHELLEDTARPTMQTDQFALGALLYALATGEHPYGGEWSDPLLNAYFQFEPTPLSVGRREWREAQEREENGVATSADQPALRFIAFVSRLLASDPDARFETAQAMREAADALVGQDLVEADAALEAGVAALEQASVEQCVERVQPWCSSETLPGLWREQLVRWFTVVDADRTRIRRERELERLLDEAQGHADLLAFDEARGRVDEVLADEHATPELRQRAQQLQEEVNEQERFVRSGAGKISDEYLRSAREQVEQHELTAARELLDGLMNDPATPHGHKNQARQLLAQIELIEQAEQRQRDELRSAEEELGAWRLDAAKRRIEALLAADDLLEDVGEPARALREKIAEALEQRALAARALDRAEESWASADLETMRAAMAEVGSDTRDRVIAQRRSEVDRRAATLEQGLGAERKAEESLGEDDPAGALEHVRAFVSDSRADGSEGQPPTPKGAPAASAPTLPEPLVQRLADLKARCQTALEQQRKERVAAARSALEAASEAFERIELDRCRALLDQRVACEPALPDEDRAKADDLLARCEAAGAVREQLATVRAAIADEALDDAARALSGIDGERQPAALRSEIETVAGDLERARAAYRDRCRKELDARLEKADAAIAAGSLAEAERLLGEVERATGDGVSPADADQPASLREALAGAQETCRLLERARRELESGDELGLERGRAALETVPEDGPTWVAKQRADVEQVTRQLEQALSESRRQRALRQAGAAEEAIGTWDAAAASDALRRARNEGDLDESLSERITGLEAMLAELEGLQPRREAIRELRDADRLVEALAEADRLCGAVAERERLLPAAEAERDAIAGALDARRTELDEELARLDRRLARRGRRARSVPKRAAEIGGDPIATEAQQARARALIDGFERAPRRKTEWFRLSVGGAVAVIALALAGWWFFGSAPRQSPATEPPSSAERRVDGDVPSDDATAGPVVEAVRDETTDRDVARGSASRADGASSERGAGDADVGERDAGQRLADAGEVDGAAGEQDRAEAARDEAGEPEVAARTDDAPVTQGDEKAQRVAHGGDAQDGDRTESTEIPGDDAAAEVAGGDGSRQEDLEETQEPDPEQEIRAARDAYVAAVQDRLGDDVSLDVQAPEVRVLAIGGRYERHALLPFEPVVWDADTAAFAPPAEEAIAHLLAQRAALDALTGDSLRTALASGETRTVHPVQDAAAPRLLEVTPDGVRVRVSARLPDQDRAKQAPLGLTGTWSDGVLHLDTEGTRALVERESQIRRDRGIAQIAQLAREDWPEAVALRVGDGFTGGSDMPWEATLAGDVVERFDAAWNDAAGEYAITSDELREVLQRTLVERARTEATQSIWPELQKELRRATVPIGAQYLSTMTLRGVQVAGPDAGQLDRARVEMTLGPPDATEPEQMALASDIHLTPEGRWWLTPEALLSLRKQAASGLQRLNGDAAFRARRADDAQQRLPAGAQLTGQGDTLTAEGNAGGTQRRYTARWDDARLAYGPWSEQVVAPPGIEGTLTQLANQPAISSADLGTVLLRVTREKAGQAGGYDVDPRLSGVSASEVPARIAAELRSRLRGGGSGPAPTTFVEYFAGDSAVYGLGWWSDGTTVREPAAWRVMDTGRLRSLRSAEQVRAAASTDLGERLLGPALGASLSGDGKAFGVALAPDGPLWLVRWEQVQFSPRAVRDVAGAGGAGEARHLHDLLRSGASAGIWCLPSLAAAADGGGATVRLADLDFNGGRDESRFRAVPKMPGLLMVEIEDHGVQESDFAWARFLQALEPADLGNAFWQRGWDERWRPKRITSLALLPTR